MGTKRKSKQPPPDSSDSLGADFGTDGVDVTLIRWMLSLTPMERLRVLQDHVNAVMKFRNGPTLR
jgi:hypothetical protein